MQENRKKLILIIVFVFVFLFLFPAVRSTKPLPNDHRRRHFVLVHGAGHGAWSWYKVETLLKSSGHNVTALDLAASGIDPRQARTLKSISEYFQPLMDFVEALSLDEKVILVGHSFGGFAVSKAMEEFSDKISVAVFVTAFMPGPSLNVSTIYKEVYRRTSFLGPDTRYTYDDGPNKPPTTFLVGPLTLASRLYQLSPIEDLTLASTLIRPHRSFSEEDKNKELRLSSKKYGSVKRVYVVAEKDLTIERDFQWWMINKNMPNHVVEITGSDHMVMISKPLELSLQLQRVAQEYF